MTPRAPTDVAPLIAALTRRLQQLGALHLPLVAGDILAGAMADLTALSVAVQGTPPPMIDRSTFDTLLSLAGPQVAPDLLRQLAEDLAGVAAGLGPALAQQDRAEVRAQTHVLMALAGSVGATPLYAAAERLNRAAHNGDGIDDIGPVVLAGLAELRHFIDDTANAPHTEGHA